MTSYKIANVRNQLVRQGSPRQPIREKMNDSLFGENIKTLQQSRNKHYESHVLVQ